MFLLATGEFTIDTTRSNIGMALKTMTVSEWVYGTLSVGYKPLLSRLVDILSLVDCCFYFQSTGGCS